MATSFPLLNLQIYFLYKCIYIYFFFPLLQNHYIIGNLSIHFYIYKNLLNSRLCSTSSFFTNRRFSEGRKLSNETLAMFSKFSWNFASSFLFILFLSCFAPKVIDRNGRRCLFLYFAGKSPRYQRQKF